MPATLLVILLSIGSYQASIPGVTQKPSPRFEDTAQGLQDFARWARATVPEPKFNQPPLRICVVGASPFSAEKPPYLPKPLWESKPPLHALEPYAATFHYVEPQPGAAPPKPRTMAQAVKLCSEAAAK